MQLLYLKPSTPGQRHRRKIQKSLLLRNTRILKFLIRNITQKVGRSSLTGHVTSWHRGAGVKKLYRFIQYNTTPVVSIVLFSAYDPFRTSKIVFGVFDFLKKSFSFVAASKNMPVGSIFSTRKTFAFYDISFGFRTFLKYLPYGTILNSISLQRIKSNFPQYVKAAGVFCVLIQRGLTLCTIRLPSGRICYTSTTVLGTIGCISNTAHRFIILGKAGLNRMQGFRPCVRGVAMNPVDHPHGGRTKGGKPSVTPWSKPTRGQKTSRSKKK